MTYRIHRVRKVLDISGISSTTIYRMVDRHDFQPPIRLGIRVVSWRENAILKWIESPRRERANTQDNSALKQGVV
ncbi:helix-turn-helix transcriptional regulator [Sulfitobacter sp. M21595]|uniref:helix-turn-helix transcriptional regulator n=1 Tax=Sulfitobacter sp. M21595 TaxID=3368574 RepID=UPI0037453107